MNNSGNNFNIFYNDVEQSASEQPISEQSAPGQSSPEQSIPEQPEQLDQTANIEQQAAEPSLEKNKKLGSTALAGREAEKSNESFARKTFERAKKAAALGLSLILTTSFLTACGGGQKANHTFTETGSSESIVEQQSETALATQQAEAATVSGEQENGLNYDYSGYNSPEKLNRNNFGEDLRKYHGNRDAMVGAMMSEAGKNPEMLVAEAYHILTPSQKERAGIANMKINEIDNLLNGQDGGKYQQAIFRELDTVMHDKEHTKVVFITAHGRAWSALEYNIDKNGDGQQTPDETYIGTSSVYRNNVKQFKVINAPNDQEKTDTNINEYCGAQPDTPEKPEGVKEIQPDETVKTPPEEPTTTPTEIPTNPPTEKPTEWGKEGDPHGGPDVIYSDEVDPDSEVSKEQNDDTNKDNQGYEDDGQATPGSPSDNGGSYNENRLPGGENQGGYQTNGANEYNNPEQNDQGRQIDNSGNESQQQAQDEGASPGEDNYSDAEEENPENW